MRSFGNQVSGYFSVGVHAEDELAPISSSMELISAKASCKHPTALCCPHHSLQPPTVKEDGGVIDLGVVEEESVPLDSSALSPGKPLSLLRSGNF